MQAITGGSGFRLLEVSNVLCALWRKWQFMDCEGIESICTGNAGYDNMLWYHRLAG